MAKTAEIKKRIDSVESIGAITNAMYLVSMAKLQKNQKRIETLKIYETLVQSHMKQIFAASRHTDAGLSNPFLSQKDKIENVAYIVFTSDLGLCGGYNVNVMRRLKEEIERNSEQTPYVYMVGKSGINKAPHYGIDVYRSIESENEVLRYSELREAIMNDVIDGFYEGRYDAIRVLYTKYVNPLVQKITLSQIVPFSVDGITSDEKAQFAPYTIFEPSPEEVLEYLMRKNIKSTTYIHYLEAQTSEEAIRRLAMDNANKNGNELVEKLKLQYNRVRQAGITQEMAEIIGGSESAK